MEFIARQPIFDLQRNLVAYELLHRSSEENRCAEPDLEVASRQMMGTAMLLGFDRLASGHTVFLNCSEGMLTGGYPTLFPPKQTVVEVLETVTPSREVVHACSDLKSAGYRIALDDFENRPEQSPLVDLADIIKVDFRLTSSTARAALVREYANGGRAMLAEKVESDEEYANAAKQGYSLFQGYFFCKPRVLSTKSVRSVNPQQGRIMRLLGREMLDFHEVEMLIKSDPALCYRLLRYLNSAAFTIRGEVRSVMEAVTLLGERDLRKWLLLVSTIMAGNRKPELVKLALVRARFAETIGPILGLSGPLVFLLGLLSLMDAILELPVLQVAEQLAVPDEIRSALLGNPSQLRLCLDLVMAYELGDWEQCDLQLRECRLPMDALAAGYCNAVTWTEHLVNV